MKKLILAVIMLMVATAAWSQHKVCADELTQILTEALEYIPDGDRNYLETEITATTLLYIPPHRTLKDDAEEEAQKAQAELDRLKKQTELHKKIKQILKRMKGE